MEVSDTEEEYSGQRKRSRNDYDDRGNLKEENDSLRCQLEAYKNEVDLVRSDLKGELEQKDKQLKMLQQTLQGMQQQLMDSKRRQNEDEAKVRELQAVLQQMKAEPSAADSNGENIVKVDGSSLDLKDDDSKMDLPDSIGGGQTARISEREAKLIGLISTFLHVHPFGAGVDYVWSYLQKLEPTLRPGEVETLMSRFPTVFRQELSGIGANMERRWQFTGFQANAH